MWSSTRWPLDSIAARNFASTFASFLAVLVCKWLSAVALMASSSFVRLLKLVWLCGSVLAFERT